MDQRPMLRPCVKEEGALTTFPRKADTKLMASNDAAFHLLLSYPQSQPSDRLQLGWELRLTKYVSRAGTRTMQHSKLYP